MNLVKILLLVAVVISLGCKKEPANIKSDSKIYFAGITKTDIDGSLLSLPDTTDWRFDDHWNSKENNLFSSKYLTSNQKCTTSICLFPNPFNDIFMIDLNKMPAKSRIAFRLVNKEFKVIMSNDSVKSSISIMPSDISTYDTLRLYYKLIDSLNFEYKGHGDILIKK
jgi:hypothetical protein